MKNNFVIITDPRVEEKFDKYPTNVRMKMENIRRMIYESAEENDHIQKLEETLKWGEPSYITKHGSTLRIDWKLAKPDQYALYFQCTSKLVPSFRSVYPKSFTYEGNRSIIIPLEKTVDEKKLKTCIKAALTYHKVKNKPNLDIEVI